MLLAQDRLESEHAAEVVRADFDAGFADLEGRLADRMLALLEHQHLDVRRLALQLPGQRQPGQAPSGNHGVVSGLHVGIVADGGTASGITRSRGSTGLAVNARRPLP